MKNKLIIDKGKGTLEYDILFRVDTIDKDVSYLIYSNDEKTRDGEIICYAGVYSKKDGKQTLNPIQDEYTLEFLDSVLLQVQNKMNVELGE